MTKSEEPEFKTLTFQREKLSEKLPCLRGARGETTSDYIQAQKEIYQINRRLESLELFSKFQVGMLVKKKNSSQPGIISDMGKDEKGNLTVLVQWDDKSELMPAQLEELIPNSEANDNFSRRLNNSGNENRKIEPSQAKKKQLSKSDNKSDKFHQWLEPNLINLTAGTQSRLTIDFKTIERYREDMIEGRWNYQESPPVIFLDDNNYYPGDGHHRIKSAKLAGVKIYCEIRRGTLREAIRYSCSANQRPSLHRTNADKRRAVELMYQSLIEEFGSLDAIPQSQGGARKEQDWGIRKIAKHVGVGKSLVSDVRAQLELTVRIGQFQKGDRVEVICPKKCKPLNWINTGTQGTVLGTNQKRGVYVRWDLQSPNYIHPERLKAAEKPLRQVSKPKASSQLSANTVTHIRENIEETVSCNLSTIPSSCSNQFSSDSSKTLSRNSNPQNFLPEKNNSSLLQMSNSNANRSVIKALEQVLEIIEFSLTGTCLDFCAADSAIANILKKTQLKVITSNINSNSKTDYSSNGSIQKIWKNSPEVDWIISYPSYNKVSDVLPLAYDKAKKGLIILLKLSYLEPHPERAEWLAKHPPTQLICLPRRTLENEGSVVNAPTAWFIWQQFSF